MAGVLDPATAEKAAKGDERIVHNTAGKRGGPPCKPQNALESRIRDRWEWCEEVPFEPLQIHFWTIWASLNPWNLRGRPVPDHQQAR